MYSNCDQFLNKRDELAMIISSDKPDLIFLSEVIPKSQRLAIHPALLSLQGYTLFLNFNTSLPDLGRRGKRGIGMFIANHLKAVEVTMSHQPLVEHLWLEISSRHYGKLLKVEYDLFHFIGVGTIFQ